jgi:hypothetical protein
MRTFASPSILPSIVTPEPNMVSSRSLTTLAMLGFGCNIGALCTGAAGITGGRSAGFSLVSSGVD